MDFETLFGLMYTKFRGEESPPDSTDPEWEIAVRNYNAACLRMQSYDDTKWNHLYTTRMEEADGTSTVTSGTSEYETPDNMAEAPAFVDLIDSNGNRTKYPVIQPHEVQITSRTSPYAYFTGDQNNGFTLHLNPTPDATVDGYTIDYMYYRKPILLDPNTEDGSTIIEGGDPAFYYWAMAAQRFLDSRNFPAYQVALRDSEEALKGMRLKNNSGSYYNPWSLMDTSGSGWGR